MTTKRYQWRPGRHPKTSAQVVGQWLESLPSRRPDEIVQAARSKKSPVHDYLWTIKDADAAHEHRLLLARLMLSSLSIDVVIYERNKKRTVQAQAIIHSSREGDYDYVGIAMGDPPKRDFILAQAMAELQATKRRYAHLVELATIFSAIDRVENKITRRRAA